MSTKDHPNSAPGMPMLFPPWLDRLQVKYMNPMAKRLAPYLPTFAILKHRGRTSGKSYETVLNAYRKGGVVAVAMGHGKANWVKNVLAAGEADMQLSRRDLHITNPRIVPAATTAEGVHWFARLQGRQVALFVADIA
jgi:deazaflavin-dependent oxidoreductase (nitroreductase family)